MVAMDLHHEDVPDLLLGTGAGSRIPVFLGIGGARRDEAWTKPAARIAALIPVEDRDGSPTIGLKPMEMCQNNWAKHPRNNC